MTPGATAGAAGADSQNPPLDFPVLQQAAQWFAVLRSPAVSAEHWREWREWCDANAAHRAAWARVEAISGKFEYLPTHSREGARQALTIAAKRQITRRSAMKMLSVVCGTGAAGWLVLRGPHGQAWTADYRSATGEQRKVRLADDTDVWLNSATALDVDYTPTLRRVIVRAGEILVQTAEDNAALARPFVVDTAQGRLRALGTRFSVRQYEDASDVAVFEGAVEIRTTRGGADARIVRAGECARFSASAVGAPEPADAMRQAWTRGLLLAENIRLGDFIDELARHRRGYLGCAPEVADLRIVGAYALADTDRVLLALESTLPVRVHRTLPWWVVVGAA